tara:strand:+ start:515 stop:622 length:108 start_codon:yes stop_codon:yes gene_type:complete
MGMVEKTECGKTKSKNYHSNPKKIIIIIIITLLSE